MNDPRTFEVTALVLRHHLVGEADKLLVLFTREDGIRRAIAKGVRKAKSKLAGQLEPFRESRITLAWGRSLHVVATVESLRRFPGILTDYDALAAGMAANEVLLAFLEEHDPHPVTFDRYVHLLATLDAGMPPHLALLAFELHLLDDLGFRPELTRCVACDLAIESPHQVVGLHLEAGGIICADCEDDSHGPLKRLSGKAWLLLVALQQQPFGPTSPLLRSPTDTPVYPVTEPDAWGEAVIGNARLALSAYLALRAERDLTAQRMFDWQPG